MTCVLVAVWLITVSQWQAIYVGADGLVVPVNVSFGQALMLEQWIGKEVVCPLRHNEEWR